MGIASICMFGRIISNHLGDWSSPFKKIKGKLFIQRNLLEVWVKDCQDENNKIFVGEQLRKILNMDYKNLVFYFKRH